MKIKYAILKTNSYKVILFKLKNQYFQLIIFNDGKQTTILNLTQQYFEFIEKEHNHIIKEAII